MSNYKAIYISAIIWQKNNVGECGVILNLSFYMLSKDIFPNCIIL